MRKRFLDDSQLLTSLNVIDAISLVDSPKEIKAQSLFSFGVNVGYADPNFS